MSLSALINEGFASLNDDSSGVARKVVVTGLSRSGTTMIAVILESFGYYLGDLAKSAVKEDVLLSRAIESGNVRKVAKINRDYSERYERWAFKRPYIFDFVAKFPAFFEDAHMIVTFRDPLAIALRNKISVGSDLFESMARSASEYNRLIEYLRVSDRPTLLVSFEKALLDPGRCAREIARFLRLEDKVELDEAAGRIQRDPEVYLVEARNSPYRGAVAAFGGDWIGGWVKFNGSSIDVPVKVELRHESGLCLMRGVADQHRPNLFAAGLGDCGFTFSVKGLSPTLLSQCSVYGVDDVVPLRLSPQACEQRGRLEEMENG